MTRTLCRLTTRSALVVLTAATLAGCSFTTTPDEDETSGATTQDTQSTDQADESAGAPEDSASTSGDQVSAATADPSESAPAAAEEMSIEDLIATFDDAGLVDEEEGKMMVVDGLATEGWVWNDDSGGYFELYYVDADLASPEILENQQLARDEGYMDFDGFPVVVDDVKGPFMVSYSSASDYQELKAVWEEATQGLE